jgi:hypothetical protein
MKRRMIICKGCKQTKPHYGRGFCASCWARANYQKKKERIKSGGAPSQKVLFHEIWEERPHVSFLSGKELFSPSSTFFYSQFAHVLSKKKYPKLTFLKENIVLLTPDEHFAFDMRAQQKREELHPECDWDKLYKLKYELMLKYINTHDKK